MLAIDDGASPLRVVQTDGTVRFVTSPGGLTIYPEFSPDGQWIYYASEAGGWSIRRVRRNGSNDEPVFGGTGLEVAPSLSPSGGELVLTRTGADQLYVLNFSSQSLRSMGPGHTPAWRPQGDRIAFWLGGQVWTMLPDGSDRRLLSRPGRRYDLGIDWSPDGNWVVAFGPAGVDLIQHPTGVTINLAFTVGWAAPSWKP